MEPFIDPLKKLSLLLLNMDILLEEGEKHLSFILRPKLNQNMNFSAVANIYVCMPIM